MAALLTVDFTGASAGGMSAGSGSGSTFATTYGGLRLTRASGATVQTSASTVVTGLAVDTARFGRVDSGSMGLLLEEGRTNLFGSSRDQTSGGWLNDNSSHTVTTNVGAGPDGSALADRVQVSGGSYGRYMTITQAAPVVMSSWVRANTGTSVSSSLLSDSGVSVGAVWNTTVSTTWQRLEAYAASGTMFYQILTDSEGLLGNSSSAQDVWVDLAQFEVGKGATSIIVTTAGSAARSGDRLYVNTGSSVITGSGDIRFEANLRPLWAATNYQNNLRLWTIDASNYAEISASTRQLSVTVGGVTRTFTTAMSWSALDSVDIWVVAGASAATVAKYRVNGGTVTDLGNPGTLGTVSASGTLDVLSNGTSNVFSTWVYGVTFHGAGESPVWVSGGGGSVKTATGSTSATATVSGSAGAKRLRTGTASASATVTATAGAKRLATGSTSASATVTGTGGAKRLATGSTSAAATVTGTGRRYATRTGTVSGSAMVTGAAGAKRLATGSTTGTATLSATGGAKRLGSGSTTGTATVTGTAGAKRLRTGAVTGTATVTGTGSKAGAATGTTTGTATVTGSAGAKRLGAGSSTASATVTGTAGAKRARTGSTTGTATVTGNGLKTGAATGTTAGVATVTGTGRAYRAGTGTTTGTATVTGTGRRFATRTGTTSGAATVTGSGAILGKATGSTAGVATVTGAAGAMRLGTGSTAGVAVTISTAGAIRRATGTASASATVTGTATALRRRTGSVTGSATVSGTALRVRAGTGTTSGAATLTGSGAALRRGAGSVTGAATATGAGGAIRRAIGTTSGVAFLVGIGVNLSWRLPVTTYPRAATVASANTIRTVRKDA